MRTFGLLDGRLFDECLRLGHQGGGHDPQQRRGSNELLARSRGRVQIVDVEVGVDAVTGLSAQLASAFAVRGGFPGNGGLKQPHRAVLLCELGLKLACLSQLCVDVGPPRWQGGRGAWLRSQAWSSSRTGGTSPSPASTAFAAFAWSLVITMQLSHAGS
jgi:hypothetical protein